MRKFVVLTLLLVFNVSFLPVAKSTEEVRPPSISHRCGVFEQYYLQNPENDDPTIFQHLQQWHDLDYRAIRAHVQQPVHLEKLARVSEAISQSYADQQITFAKNAVAYFLYSKILSADMGVLDIEDINNYDILVNKAINYTAAPAAFCFKMIAFLCNFKQQNCVPLIIS